MNELDQESPTPATQLPHLRIHLLGPMQIEREGEPIHLPRRKVESLLAYLLLYPERHGRDQLATLFWGDSSDAQARHSLRTALATVRQQVSADLLLTDRDHVQLNDAYPLWTDLHQLLALEKHFEQANPDMLQAHLALWQGELLDGFYDEWIANAREHYQARLIKLFLSVVHSLRARSEYAQAIAIAQGVLAHEPANEHAHQHLMFCYVASGNRPAALRQYEQCERALLEDVDAPPSPETVALYQWIKQYRGEETSTAAKITNLPLPLSSFIGRTRETAEIKRLLTGSRNAQGVRLLTLIGAGGSGKTRLSIQVATDLIDSYDYGVWWVELAALIDGALVGRAVAKTLGVREVADKPLAQSLVEFIGDKSLLLVFDNCEHLIESCTQLAAELLAHCPNLQILATSREPLNITGEILWQVPTFAVPDPNKLGLLDLLMQFDSLRLFVERATTVQPSFALTLENAQAVAEICRRLDGIPLAIELAAARVKVLTVEQIAEYLTSVLGARFALLTQGSRAAMPRHQTLRATIDWSYNLLDEAERLLFRQIAVFRGGFTLELLDQVVASAARGTQPTLHFTLDRLTQLVDKSLVIVEPSGGQNRYRVLETLREYALEQFPNEGELRALQARHAEVFLALAVQAEPELTGARQQFWLDRLEIEHGNLRAALEYLIHEDHGDRGAGTWAEKSLWLATVLHRFWEVRGYVSEGRSWLKAALAQGGTVDHETRAKALNAAGRLAFRQGDFAHARQCHEEARLLFEQAEEEVGIVDTMNYLATIDISQGDYTHVQRNLEQALELARSMNYEVGVANTFSRLGTLAWDQDRFADSAKYHGESRQMYQRLDMPLSIAFETLGVGDSERMLNNFDSARTHYEECLQIARQLGHRGLIAASQKSLGLLAFRQQDYEQARLYSEEALQSFRELGDKVHAAFALSQLGDVALKAGENSRALAYFGEYLKIMFEVGYKWPTFYALEDIAELLTEVEQHTEAAVRLLGAADVLRHETGLAVSPQFQEKYDRMLATLCEKTGDVRFAALWQEGEKTPLAQIVDEATNLSLEKHPA